MNHKLNYNTLVCSCGRTVERHLEIELASDRVKTRWMNGDVDLERDFAEIDKAVAI